MANEKPIDGTNLRFYIGGDPIGMATSCTLSLSKETRQTVHKDNVGGWQSSSAGTKSAEISFEGFAFDDPSINAVDVKNVDDLFDAFNSDDALDFSFSTGENGTTVYSGQAHLTALSITSPVNEDATYSGSGQVTGEVAKATIGA